MFTLTKSLSTTLGLVRKSPEELVDKTKRLAPALRKLSAIIEAQPVRLERDERGTAEYPRNRTHRCFPTPDDSEPDLRQI